MYEGSVQFFDFRTLCTQVGIIRFLSKALHVDFFLYLSTQDSEYLMHVIGAVYVLLDIYLQYLYFKICTSMNEFVFSHNMKKKKNKEM